MRFEWLKRHHVTFCAMWRDMRNLGQDEGHDKNSKLWHKAGAAYSFSCLMNKGGTSHKEVHFTSVEILGLQYPGTWEFNLDVAEEDKGHHWDFGS